MCNIFDQIKAAKPDNKHMVIIESLIDNGIRFEEDSELCYKLHFDQMPKVQWYVRTNILRIINNGKTQDTKLNSFVELLNIINSL
jgi:hypothetical protein